MAILKDINKYYNIGNDLKKYHIKNFVETGTGYGDSVEYCNKELGIKKIWSIEIQKELAKAARNKFKECQNCRIIQNNSTDGLNYIIPRLTGSTLFFLDASAGNVAVTVAISDLDRIFVRVDGTANTAIITPATGNINGATSYNVAAQYEKITIVSDGTDLYF